jgi:hypothetical protein
MANKQAKDGTEMPKPATSLQGEVVLRSPGTQPHSGKSSPAPSLYHLGLQICIKVLGVHAEYRGDSSTRRCIALPRLTVSITAMEDRHQEPRVIEPQDAELRKVPLKSSASACLVPEAAVCVSNRHMR